ncbi:LemA family protein [Litorimonas taeanensis]|uniref:LemA family protein n=1 Tax=Litorimonas taeanensis TaxID=568099 RepID=UPI0038993C5B
MWTILAIFIALLVGVALVFNQLVQARQMVSNGWADIAVQLKRRADLIPNIVDTVKAYAQHERQLFIDVTEKRNAALSAGDNPKARGAAEGALAQPVTRLLAVAEDYPDLKASQNFLDLQNELSETEDKIEMARRFYNGAVRQYNTKVESVPSNLVAAPFGFKQADYFNIAEEDYAVPTVDI